MAGLGIQHSSHYLLSFCLIVWTLTSPHFLQRCDYHAEAIKWGLSLEPSTSETLEEKTLRALFCLILPNMVYKVYDVFLSTLTHWNHTGACCSDSIVTEVVDTGGTGQRPTATTLKALSHSPALSCSCGRLGDPGQSAPNLPPVLLESFWEYWQWRLGYTIVRS